MIHGYCFQGIESVALEGFVLDELTRHGLAWNDFVMKGRQNLR